MNFLYKTLRVWATFDEYACLTHIKLVTWPREKDNDREKERERGECAHEY